MDYHRIPGMCPWPFPARGTLGSLCVPTQTLPLNPFAPKSDQCQISPAASPEILHQRVWRTGLFMANSNERRLYYQYPLRHLYIYLWKVWENVPFLNSLVVKGLKSWLYGPSTSHAGFVWLFAGACFRAKRRSVLDSHVFLTATTRERQLSCDNSELNGDEHVLFSLVSN